MKKTILTFTLIALTGFVSSGYALEDLRGNAPSGLYLTSGFSNQDLNGLLLLCDGGSPNNDPDESKRNEYQSWCQIYQNESSAQRVGSTIVLDIDGQKHSIATVTNVKPYLLILEGNFEKQQGNMLKIEPTQLRFEKKSWLSWSLVPYDANASFLVLAPLKKTAYRLVILDSAGGTVKTIQSEHGTYQF